VATVSPKLTIPFTPPPTRFVPAAFGFRFLLVHPDGEPADPPAYLTAIPSWKPGDEFLADNVSKPMHSFNGPLTLASLKMQSAASNLRHRLRRHRVVPRGGLAARAPPKRPIGDEEATMLRCEECGAKSDWEDGFSHVGDAR